MSLRANSDVAQLVRKYKTRYPKLDRDLLRKLIRLENPNLFSKKENTGYLSNLRKLDRKLKKAFESEKPPQLPPAKLNVAPRESEVDKAEAIKIMRSFEALIGNRFSEEEWNYVMDPKDGKRMLDKARALVQLKGSQAFLY